jgi:hypothetical protein
MELQEKNESHRPVKQPPKGLLIAAYTFQPQCAHDPETLVGA